MPADRPAPPAADGAPALELANRLRPVLVRIGRRLRGEVHSTGLTAGQAAVLASIHAHPGIGPVELADRERTSTPSMCAAVDRLAASGLVIRTRDGSDRRRVGMTVTPAGERVLRTIRSRRTAWLATHLRDLTAADLAAIDAALEPLQRLASAEP
jgi:DNA-binding MarR family transcriptional regulator